MEDIWPLIARFVCVMAFGVFLMILNLKIGSVAGRRFSYYFLLGSIFVMVLQLIQITIRVNEVTK